MLALLVACAGLPLGARAAEGGHARLRAHGPGTVFHSVEAAALDALSYAHLEETPIDRQRLRVGSIYRVSNGYAYTAPKRSAAVSPLMVPSVRYRLRAIDVARYTIPPRSGRGGIDRLNEEPSSKEKQIVDVLDPAHRPVYLLTPSLKIVSYRHGGWTTVVTDLNELAASQAAKPVSAALSALLNAKSTALLARCPAAAGAD